MHEPQSNAGVMLYDDDYYSDCADYVSSCASYFAPACAYAGKCDTTCQFARPPRSSTVSRRGQNDGLRCVGEGSGVECTVPRL